MENTAEVDEQSHELYWETKLGHEFYKFLKLKENSGEDEVEDDKLGQEFFKFLKLNENDENSDEEGEKNEEHEEDEEDEEEFSFMLGGETHESSIAAEDAFTDGQIKGVFPLFNRDLLFSDSDLPKSPVRKVFVETEENHNHSDRAEMTSSATKSDAITGPYCDWSNRKAVEVSSSTEVKKSNSTGFSRIWRFKEFRERCNSDGRDAFVFLNKSHAPPKQKAAPPPPPPSTAEKVKKSGKKKVSAHETYLLSKAKDDRRRTYLPYRPELMGFFTNVSSGGLTRNVHPY